MIAIGVGYTSSVTADDVIAAIDAAKSKCGEPPALIATVAKEHTSTALELAARHVGLPLQLIDRLKLQERASQCLTRSEHSLVAYGVGSVAEAAALVAAGPNSHCIVPRMTFARVTVAAAQSQRDELP